MRDFFRYLFKPDFWMSLYPVDKEWDQILNEILDSDEIKITRYDSFEVSLNGISIWIANYPYAYGCPTGCSYTFLPKKRTREKLHNFLENQKFNNYKISKRKFLYETREKLEKK